MRPGKHTQPSLTEKAAACHGMTPGGFLRRLNFLRAQAEFLRRSARMVQGVGEIRFNEEVIQRRL